MFHRVSLKTILIGGAILAAVIPAVLVGIALVGSLHDSAIRDATARHELLAQGLASEHDRFLTSHRQAVQMLTRHVENHRSLGEGGVTPLLAQTRASYPEFAAIAILDPSGRVVASDPPTTEDGRSTTAIDLSDRAWFREIVQGHRVIVYPDVEVSGIRQSGFGLPIGAPISDGSGGLRGAVAAWLRLDAIQTLTNRIRFGNTGYALLTTAGGKILAHESAAYVRERRDFSQLPIWSVVRARDFGQIPRYAGMRGDPRLAGFATVPDVGWKVLVTQAHAEVQENLYLTYGRLLIWTILALLATVALAIVVATYVSRPISALRTTASAIAAGDATRPVPQGGPQEVADLAQAFESMIGRLTAAQGALESRLGETAALLAIAKVVGGTLDLPEALRRVCSELAHLTGAGTVAAHLVDADRTRLEPVAAYHVPKHLLEAVATSPVPLAEQGFRETVFEEGRVAWSDDVAHDPRFAFPLFRAFPHQSGLIIPLVLENQVAGTLYLVWWRERRRFDDAEIAVLQAVGQQAGILLRSARLHAATERQAHQATRLYEVAGQLASSLDLERVLDRVAQTTLDLLSLRRLGHLRLRRGSWRARAPAGIEPGSRAEPGSRPPARRGRRGPGFPRSSPGVDARSRARPRARVHAGYRARSSGRRRLAPISRCRSPAGTRFTACSSATTSCPTPSRPPRSSSSRFSRPTRRSLSSGRGSSTSRRRGAGISGRWSP